MKNIPVRCLSKIVFSGCLYLGYINYSLYGAEGIDQYLQFYRTYAKALGDGGDHREGEIELLLEPNDIEKAQEAQRKRLVKKGMDEKLAFEASRVGIISQDNDLIFLREAVTFPNGTYGLCNRIIYKGALSGSAGVIIAPMLPDGRLALILNFRHATRSWELELPRGGRFEQETVEQTAIRECLEETGYRLQNPTVIGQMTLDSGIANTVVPLVLGFASEKRSSQADDFEAIEGVLAFTKQQLKESIKKGYFEISFKDQVRKLSLRDPAISYAIIAAEERGLW